MVQLMPVSALQLVLRIWPLRKIECWLGMVGGEGRREEDQGREGVRESRKHVSKTVVNHSTTDMSTALRATDMSTTDMSNQIPRGPADARFGAPARIENLVVRIWPLRKVGWLGLPRSGGRGGRSA